MPKIEPLISAIEQAMAPLEKALDGCRGSAGDWFDGFWDFVVENRERIKAGPAWEINGYATQRPWSLIIISTTTAAHPVVEIYLFVEDKDYRASARAPWPVCSVVIPGNDPVRVGDRDSFDRPHDQDLAAAIERLGFTPRVGYWGIRCDWISRADASIAAVVEAVRRALANIPQLLQLALDLANTA